MTRYNSSGCGHCGTGWKWEPQRRVKIMVKTERRVEDYDQRRGLYICRVYPKDDNI